MYVWLKIEREREREREIEIERERERERERENRIWRRCIHRCEIRIFSELLPLRSDMQDWYRATSRHRITLVSSRFSTFANLAESQASLRLPILSSLAQGQIPEWRDSQWLSCQSSSTSDRNLRGYIIFWMPTQILAVTPTVCYLCIVVFRRTQWITKLCFNNTTTKVLYLQLWIFGLLLVLQDSWCLGLLVLETKWLSGMLRWQRVVGRVRDVFKVTV